MKRIGYDGGHSLYELGSVSDTILFFDCLDSYVVQTNSEQNWSLLTDRLYRRYLREDELEASLILMEYARKLFEGIPARGGVNWDDWDKCGSESSLLDMEQPTLADVFVRYFDNFSKACESVKSFLDAFEIYQPVRLISLDLTEYAKEKNIALEEYDQADGDPFWLR